MRKPPIFARHRACALAVVLSSAPLSAALAQDDFDALFGTDETQSAEPAPVPSVPEPSADEPATEDGTMADESAEADGAELLPTIPVDVAEDVPAPVEPPRTGRVIEEIVVTAQKTAQSIQDVPVSVSALSGDTLKENGTFDAGGLENLVSNVEIDVDPQAPVIGIRGFATETDNVGFEPAVGLVIDEVALGRPEFIPDGMFDIQRVEVLRGPQGTLFGKNTIAGVITFASTEPEDVFSGAAMASLGSRHLRRLEGAASVPLGEDVAARVAFMSWEQDGEIENSTLHREEGAQKQKAGRINLVARPGNWTVKLSTQATDTDVSSYAPWQLTDASDNVMDFVSDYDPEVEDDPTDAHTSFDIPGYVERNSSLSRVLLEYDAGDWGGLRNLAYTAVAGYASFDVGTIIDIDVSPADVIITDFGVGYDQTSLELRTSGGADSLFGLGQDVEFVVGVYGLTSDIDSHLTTLAGEDLLPFALSRAGFDALGLPDSFLNDILGALIPSVPLNDTLYRGFKQQTDSYAAFGQMTWHFTDRWAAIAGLRYSQDDKTADYDIYSTGLGLISLVVGADPFVTTRTRKESDVSPKFGLQFDVNDDVTTFATWTRGYKGGGFNATAESETVEDADGNEVDALEFKAEQAESYEIGIKSHLFDGSLMFNATVYRTDIENLQVVDFTGFAYTVRNAAEARLQGVEVDMQWLPPWEWLTINASFGYSSAKYLSYPDAPRTEEQRLAGQNSQDLSGKTLANAPEYSAAISPLVSFPITDNLGIRWGVDATYRGDQYSATDLDPHSFQEGYWLFGSRISIGDQDGNWALILAGNNLTDERALDQVMDHSLYSDTYVAQQIPLRSWTLSLQANWY